MAKDKKNEAAKADAPVAADGAVISVPQPEPLGTAPLPAPEPKPLGVAPLLSSLPTGPTGTEPVPLGAAPPPPAPRTRRAKVTVPGSHVGTVEVEFLDDGSGSRAAAIAAAARKIGVTEVAPGRFGFGASPKVEFVS